MVKYSISQDIFKRNFFFWDKYTFTITEDNAVIGHIQKNFGLKESTKSFKIRDIDTVTFETKFRAWIAFIIWIPYTWIIIFFLKLYYKISVKDILYDKRLIIRTHNDSLSISVAMRSTNSFTEIIDYIQSCK